MIRLAQTIDGIDRVITVPEWSVEVLKRSGWTEASEPVQANPALAPGEPETPAEPEPKSRRKTSDE